MIRIKALLAVAFLCAVMFSPAIADGEGLTGEDLFDLCVSQNLSAKDMCRSYILGAVQGLSFGDSVAMLNGQATPRAPSHFCLEEPVSSDRMIEVYVAAVGFLKMKYPGDLKNSAITIVNAAMATAYPCPRRQNRAP